MKGVGEMVDLTGMTACPVTIDLGGEKRKLSPLTLMDMARNDDYLAECALEERSRRLNHLATDLKALGDLVDGKVRDDMIAEVLREGKTDGVGSVRSVGHMLWMSLRKTDAALTQDDVLEMVTLGNVKAVQEALDKISGLKSEEGDPTQAPQSTGEASTEP